MKLQALSETYAVRRLEPKDVECIYEMMRKNVMFYEYHPPFVTRESILADMKALPPQKQEADKFYAGFFDGEKLAAVLDLIVSYPDGSAAFIGFFMTDVQCQNQGVGTRIVTELCQSLKELGYKRVCLGVDKGNPQSRAFWTKNGFCRVGEKTYVLMERQLSHKLSVGGAQTKKHPPGELPKSFEV